MRTRFEEQLELLNQEMIKMGSLIERAMEKTGALLLSRNLEDAHALMQGDHEVDRMEREIETLCLRLILMQQPVARDLRLISSALKMITDMERIGDQASDIAEILTMPLVGEPLDFPGQLGQMAEKTALMVRKAIDAYVNRDAALSLQVIEDDDEVDSLFDQVKRELMNMIDAVCRKGHHQVGMQLLDMLMIAKYFERSADHAVNIAEWVQYAVTGMYKGEPLS